MKCVCLVSYAGHPFSLSFLPKPSWKCRVLRDPEPWQSLVFISPFFLHGSLRHRAKTNSTTPRKDLFSVPPTLSPSPLFSIFRYTISVLTISLPPPSPKSLTSTSSLLLDSWKSLESTSADFEIAKWRRGIWKQRGHLEVQAWVGLGEAAAVGRLPSLVMMMECWVEEDEEEARVPALAWSFGR